MPEASDHPAGAPPRFSVHASSVDGHFEVTVRGELDLATAPLLRELTLQAGDSSAPTVLVDLQELVAMDSTGLKTLLDLHRVLITRGAALVLTPCTGQVRRVFEICGLLEVLDFTGRRRS